MKKWRHKGEVICTVCFCLIFHLCLLQKMHSLLLFHILLVTVPISWYKGRTQWNILGLMEDVCFWTWQMATLKARGCTPQSVSGLDHICLRRIWQLKSPLWSDVYPKAKCGNDLCWQKKSFLTFCHLSSPDLCLLCTVICALKCSPICQSDHFQERRWKPTICHPLFPC